MKQKADGAGKAVGQHGGNKNVLVAVRQVKSPVVADGETAFRSAVAGIPPPVRSAVYKAVVTCVTQVVGALATAIPVGHCMASGAHRVTKARGGHVIHCANGSLVHLPNSRGTRLLLMALANAGMSIPYEFLVQAGMTGPWELSGYQNCGKWTPSVPGGEGDSDENRDGHIGFEEGIHPVGGFLLEHCDKKALKAYRARLTKIREERLKAKAEGNGAALAALDEEAHRIESEIRNATDKTGAIRKKGPNAAEQRQFHACFERAIRIVGAQDAALGAYLKATLDRGAQFKFNGIGDEFVFDKGVLSSPTETARKAASINCLAGVGSSAENDY